MWCCWERGRPGRFVFRLADGPKGEGLAFRLDSGDLMSIGEDKSAPASLYETAQQC